MELRWYARAVQLAHLRNQTLDPIVHAYAGIRHDERFHRAGDLDGFNDPTGRVFFGFDLHPIRLAARASGNALLSFGGGFAFEGALHTTQRLPAGFRVGLSDRLDLASAFRHQESVGLKSDTTLWDPASAGFAPRDRGTTTRQKHQSMRSK